MFGEPPIAIHHDFGQCELDMRDFPSNVSFVDKWVATNWGGWGIVEGARRAIRLLYNNADPDWFVLLSGSDYPTKPAGYILDALSGQDYDVYLDNRLIDNGAPAEMAEVWGRSNHSHPAWKRMAFDRYKVVQVQTRKLTARLKWEYKTAYIHSDYFIKKLTPFNNGIECYAGDLWFTANRKAANILLANDTLNLELIEHFSKCKIPDEAFFHTVLCNHSELNICSDNKRFSDWTGCLYHPRTLTESDFPALLASSDHFARKFDFDPHYLRTLDKMVDRL